MYIFVYSIYIYISFLYFICLGVDVFGNKMFSLYVYTSVTFAFLPVRSANVCTILASRHRIFYIVLNASLLDARLMGNGRKPRTERKKWTQAGHQDGGHSPRSEYMNMCTLVISHKLCANAVKRYFFHWVQSVYILRFGGNIVLLYHNYIYDRVLLPYRKLGQIQAILL